MTSIQRACLTIGYATCNRPTDSFVCEALDWLVRQFGDIHLEYLNGDGWWVYSCNCEHLNCGGSTKALALARAVQKVKRLGLVNT